jgi:beta-lactamase superfamily II metal-dependent hydrolase
MAMPWTLDIWHIDVQGSGDATLIIARNGAVRRTALIDGGRVNAAQLVHARLVALGIGALDVMIATHYDADHLGGLTTLLAGGDPIYNATRIYDQGQQGAAGSKRRRLAGGFQTVVSFSGEENSYISYRQAIGAHGARVRVTEPVVRAGDLNGDMQNAGWEDSDWLVGQEVLWPGAAGPIPPGQPTLTCIAANQNILQADGTTRVLSSGVLVRERMKNANSLAFLLQFGNFKYYVGGDIEARQEDGSDWNGAGYTVTNADRAHSLMQILNPTNNVAGRVHAMKTSHHGSKFSSSSAFLARLQPRAAFISCGTDNQYDHPDQEVVTALENQCSYFLTGEYLNGAAQLGPQARVAGVWPPAAANPVAAGDIQLTVTAAQAAAAPPNFAVEYDRPNAGTNIHRNPAFAYAPWQRYVGNF